MKIIRDPIHGYIEVEDFILQIVSTEIFQRLRHITQTGLAYLVYPGMRHTRFEHSLGVMHLAKELTRYIKINSEQYTELDFINEEYLKLVGLSGLLHDIGHLPFSHTFENALSLAKEVYGIDVEYYGKKTHVILGNRVIDYYLGNFLDKLSKNYDVVNFVQRVISSTPRTKEESLASLIISSPLDADRGDYLLRDSYFAGVGYGNFDIERIKRSLIYVNGKLAVLKKAIPVVEQFLLARMYMYETIYFHSVVGLYNAVLSHAVAKLMQKNLIPDITPENYLKLNDVLIMSKLDEAGKEFFNSIIYRKGFKRYKKDITGNCYETLEKKRKEINEIMRENNGLILYHDFYDVPYSEDEIFVYDDDEIRPLSNESKIVSSLSIIKKGIIGYHESVEDKVKKIHEILRECSL
ncbi:HD domain-containing protein [Saccharolobus islandicus]|uniref:HD superfamily phosphohydrolase n=2 Tax=Saccharolobus islandicus TaxID=43080 RepID=M9UFX7_SACIS|nr:HD domain-containing protein [Sulfolobus islandicus]ADX86180.1 metal dependent phosphohydrolase [Sulfolobus islandicus REY15A]AGJ63531.1 HD superfamily phosphohydrolase [Sulfolobus islandicus LAL14/1]